MVDGSILLAAAAGSVTGKGLLFPVMPAPGETLPGYLLRNVEPNFLTGIYPMLEVAGVEAALGGNCINQFGKVADHLRPHFAVPTIAWAGLWGVEGLRGGRRRLGGVWLAPLQVEGRIRRVPPGHRPGDPDKAIWMVRDLGFCPATWEVLVSQCPRPGCQPLTWRSVTALHICGRCRTSVSAAKRRTVPRKYRPALTWLLGLFGNAAEQERSMVALPPVFEAPSPTDIYELVLAIARPLRVARDPSIRGRVHLEIADVAAACRFLLDFPRSHWDLQQQGDVVGSAFRYRLEANLRLSHRPSVSSDLNRVLMYGRPHKGRASPFSEVEWVSTTEAATMLRIERRDIRALADSGLLPEDSKAGGSHRTHSSFRTKHVKLISDELTAQMSLREFQSRTGLHRFATEQLLGLGLIAETTSAASKLVHCGLHITRDSAENLLTRLAPAAELEGNSPGIPLREVMLGIGGRPKPWARVLKAALDGDLPGGLRGNADSRIVDLVVHSVTARHLLMGGENSGHPFSFQVGDLAEWERPDMTPSETEEHLNCTAQDVSWLRHRGFLTSTSEEGETARFCRPDVEALGRKMISTREIAARTGTSAAQLWPELLAFKLGGALGQGFYERAVIEPWIVSAR